MKYHRLFLYIFVLFQACKSPGTIMNRKLQTQLICKDCMTDKGLYRQREKVIIAGSIQNPGSQKAQLKNVQIKITTLSRPSSFVQHIPISEAVTLGTSETFDLSPKALWTIPSDTPHDAFGVYLTYEDSSSKSHEDYVTFFRVGDDKTLTTFKIANENYKGLQIFKLDGGMSAEYAVEKSLENLTPSVSHSWEVNAPGSGPNPVMATPQFLVNSVENTVQLYNQFLGKDTPLETVIVSTGIPSMPNISNVTGAPVLPLHFLASSNTYKEIQSVLDYSNQKGLSCYATLGYDLSVPTAVAWIKLLDLPKAYLDFMTQHKVKNVYIIGSTGTTGGETQAKQVQNKHTGMYENGSLYMLYSGNTPDDIQTMKQKIVDYDEALTQPGFINISDWESGVVSAQIQHIAQSVSKNQVGTTVYSLTADDLIHLYEFGTYATLYFFKKNNIIPQGVTMNPYLVSHPTYEASKGWIPFHYWQLIPPVYTVDRLTKNLASALSLYFPDMAPSKLSVWVNNSNNFGAGPAAEVLIKELNAKGFKNIQRNDYLQDEVWNPANGMGAISEKIAEDVLAHPLFFQKKSTLKTLNDQDISSVATTVQALRFKREN